MTKDARIAAYERINEIIVTEVCGIFVYFHEAEHYLKKPNVVGMFENSTGQDAVQRRRLGDRGLGSDRVAETRETTACKCKGGL